jgi:tetratricopeptide (TPR) repeat protein
MKTSRYGVGNGARRTPRRMPRRTALALALVASGLLGCSETTVENDAPSALLITLDTTRADALSCYSGKTGATVHLDRLATEAVLYERAYTVAPVTTPAHASMLTGLYPIRHAVRGNDELALPAEAVTLAEMANDRAIQTAAFLAAVVLHGRFGLDQGFETYSAPVLASSAGMAAYVQYDARQIVDEAIGWLDDRDRSRGFLLWVHLFDPHAPYTPPEDFTHGVYLGNDYLGEVGFMDAQVGRLLAHLRTDGTIDHTTILVVGDHGEALGDHGEATHGVLCQESTLRVPMLLRHPDGFRAGERSLEMVTVADVLPTLAEALGLPALDGIDGISLLRQEVPADRGIYFESYEGYLAFGYSPLAGWIDARGKYVHGPEPRFFEVIDDPGETKDLFRQRGEIVGEFRERIGELAAKPAFAPVAGSDMSQEELGRLQALGYAAVGGASIDLPHPLEPSGCPSAQSILWVHRDIVRGMDLVSTGELAEAEAVLRGTLQVVPRSPAALLFLSFSLIDQQKHEEAIEILQRLIALRPSLGTAHFNLANCLRASDRDLEAIEAYEEAILLDPRNEKYYAQLIGLLHERGKTDEARALAIRKQEAVTPK